MEANRENRRRRGFFGNVSDIGKKMGGISRKGGACAGM
jgi:hypothetical protein